MKISCEVIRDLLPLYRDEVCSEESKALVKEHLEGCEACRKELELFDADLPVQRIEPDEEKGLNAVSSAWKKVKKRSFIIGTAITLLVCAGLLGAFMLLTQPKVIPVSAEYLEVFELSELSDGSIVFRLFVNDDKDLRLIKETITDDGCVYITPKHSVIEAQRKYDIGSFNHYFVFTFSEFDGEMDYCFQSWVGDVSKIYVGPIGNGTLVWEEGMELPAASEELENGLRAGVAKRAS